MKGVDVILLLGRLTDTQRRCRAGGAATLRPLPPRRITKPLWARHFGAAARRARNGSRSDHPLHPAYVAKNEAATAWIAEKLLGQRPYVVPAVSGSEMYSLGRHPGLFFSRRVMESPRREVGFLQL